MKQESKQRVLIVRLGSMGDVVYALPVLVTLKENFPGWEVDWLVESRWRPLLEGNPFLSEILELDTIAWRKQLLSAGTRRAFRAAVEALRSRHYDCALDLQGAVKSAVACYVSGARQVIGFRKPWLREPAAGVSQTTRLRLKRRFVLRGLDFQRSVRGSRRAFGQL